MSKNPLYFLPNSTPVSQYKELLDTKDPREDYGNAFLELGRGKGGNAKQQASNAFFTALGAGLNSTVSRDRKDKLAELEEYSRQVAITTAKTQEQLGKYNLTKATYGAWGLENITSLKSLNEMIKNNDEDGLAMNVPRLVNDFQRQNPDLGKKLGKFDHYNNGRVFFDKDGKVDGMYLRDLISPIVSNLPETDQQELGNLSSIITKQKFDRQNLANDLLLQEKRANINSSYSAAEANKAHANLYNTQAEDAKHKMQAPPPKYSKEVLKGIMTENIQWVNKLKEDHARLEAEKKAYNQIGALIAEEKDSFLGRTGTGLITQAQRAVNYSGTESEKNQALIELYKQPLMAGIKRMFAGSTSDLDIATFIAGLPTLDKNPDAAIQIAKERAAELETIIENNNLTRNVLENDFGYSEPYNSLAVQNRVEEKKNKNKSKNNDNDLSEKGRKSLGNLQ